MPGIPGIPGQELPAMLAELHMRVRALETQQQAILSNLQGQPIVALGLQPGSDPPEWGLGLLNQSYGSRLAFFGEDASGNVGLYFYDQNGNLGVKIDFDGVHIYNAPTGTEEARLGLLNASPAIYGLGVLPYGGSTLQQVGGWLKSGTVSASTVTNTTWADFTGSSSVTAEIGPSGSATVAVQGYLATGTAGEQAFVGVSVDGGTPYGFLELSSGAGGISGTIGSQYLWSGLTPGTHTFGLAYQTANNGSANCSFSGVILTVQPL